MNCGKHMSSIVDPTPTPNHLLDPSVITLPPATSPKRRYFDNNGLRVCECGRARARVTACDRIAMARRPANLRSRKQNCRHQLRRSDEPAVVDLPAALRVHEQRPWRASRVAGLKKRAPLPPPHYLRPTALLKPRRAGAPLQTFSLNR